MILVREIKTPSDLKKFIDFPYSLYKKCPYWIPPIKQQELNRFDPAKNPSFDRAEVKLWIAEKEGKVVGRIVGIINELETEARGEMQCRFGWFEFEEDLNIAKDLLEKVANWGQTKGAISIKGPVGFSNMDPAGMTVEGFEELGTMSGAFHYPYYSKFMDQLGYEKLVDLIELILDKAPEGVPEKINRLQPILEKKFGIRNFQIESKDEMRDRIRESFHLVTSSYKDLPSFVPLSEHQINHLIDQYLPFLRPEYISLVGDQEGTLLGFGVITPSFSEALVKAKGSLYPFGFLPLLWAKRNHKIVDLVLIGVVESWRGKGLNALIFAEIIKAVNKQGVKKVRINPILEENLASLSLFKGNNPRMFRRRRIFGKPL